MGPSRIIGHLSAGSSAGAKSSNGEPSSTTDSAAMLVDLRIGPLRKGVSPQAVAPDARLSAMRGMQAVLRIDDHLGNTVILLTFPGYFVVQG